MGKNTDPSPMEHVSVRIPNPQRERGALARQAADLPATELKARAAELGIPTAGAKSKEDLVAAVQSAVAPE